MGDGLFLPRNVSIVGIFVEKIHGPVKGILRSYACSKFQSNYEFLRTILYCSDPYPLAVSDFGIRRLMIANMGHNRNSIFDVLDQLDIPFDPGTWFWIENEHLLRIQSRKRFDPKEGKHPVIVRDKFHPRKFGPNVTAYPRSSTVRGEYEQKPHEGDDHLHCGIKKLGWVKISIPVSIPTSKIDNYSCTEQSDSNLLSVLRRVK